MTTPVGTGRARLRALRGVASGLEVRADLAGDPDPAVLRGLFDGELIYSLRSARLGGAFTGSTAERHRRLLAAARSYDVVELEFDHDLAPELLAAVLPHRRRVGWYGGGRDAAGLRAVFDRMARTPARLYLLAPEADTVGQAMAPLRLLARLDRSDVTAFATGDLGTCGRVLAPWFGAPVVFAALDRDGVPGLPSVEQLLADYPFPVLPPLDHVFGIVGRRTTRSLSPRLHNAAYRALGLRALYLPLPADGFSGSWRDICAAFDQLGLTFGGATVVAPFKEEALRLADSASTEARRTGAANLLVRAEDGWRAHTTDPVGVVGALRRAGVEPVGREAAVIGCGGAGRGAAAGLLWAGARPVVVNRGPERGRYAADLLGIDYLPLDRFAPEDYSIIVHATPMRDEPPFAVDRIARDAAVVDLPYGPEQTRLAAGVHARHQVVVDGWQVLEVEVDRQFRLLTGRSRPRPSAPVDGAGAPVAPPRREFAT
ncbi:hypothetical protein GCM10027184_04760 [Saccharothrix stipae]